MRLYGIYHPNGKLFCVAPCLEDAWGQDAAFRCRYWKRIGPSRRALRRRGWRVMPGRFEPGKKL